MKKHIRFSWWFDGRCLLGVSLWPIPESLGVGIGINFLWFECALYVVARAWSE